MIKLKDLCREYDMDPYPMRQLLRHRFGTRDDSGKRWQWESDKDQELKAIRRYLNTYAKTRKD